MTITNVDELLKKRDGTKAVASIVFDDGVVHDIKVIEKGRLLCRDAI